MKHLTTILAAVLLLVACVGIVLNSYYAVSNNKDYICNADYRGHSYVIVHANGSTDIIHDPGCPCQNSRTLRQLLADTAFLNQFHQASERAAAEATARTAEARRRAIGFSHILTKGGEE